MNPPPAQTALQVRQGAVDVRQGQNRVWLDWFNSITDNIGNILTIINNLPTTSNIDGGNATSTYGP